MISVVLVQPENSGNIGAIARSMANFGVSNLILIDPKADHKNNEAYSRSMHAKPILQSAKVKPYESLYSLRNDCHFIAGFTSVLGTDYNILRTPLSLKDFVKKLEQKNYAFVFGRDSSGLNNDELKACDMTVTIPSSMEYPALNLSHAVAIVLYEIYCNSGDKIKKRYPGAGGYIDIIYEKIDDLMERLSFSTPEKKITQKMTWKRTIGKSALTRREAFVIIGGLNKLSSSIRRKAKNQ